MLRAPAYIWQGGPGGATGSAGGARWPHGRGHRGVIGHRGRVRPPAGRGPVRRASVREIARTVLPSCRDRSTTRLVWPRSLPASFRPSRASTRPPCKASPASDRVADVGLDHGRVDPHRPCRKAGLALRLTNHHPGELGDDLGAQPADQLADGRLVRHPLGQRDEAEPAQVQRVRHLPDQRLVPPASALLDHHQPHEAAHRDGRPAMAASGQRPDLLDRGQQPPVDQQPVQRR
jgi:hypothetical protein